MCEVKALGLWSWWRKHVLDLNKEKHYVRVSFISEELIWPLNLCPGESGDLLSACGLAFQSPADSFPHEDWKFDIPKLSADYFVVLHSYLHIATLEEYYQPRVFKNNELGFQNHKWFKNYWSFKIISVILVSWIWLCILMTRNFGLLWIVDLFTRVSEFRVWVLYISKLILREWLSLHCRDFWRLTKQI